MCGTSSDCPYVVGDTRVFRLFSSTYSSFPKQLVSLEHRYPKKEDEHLVGSVSAALRGCKAKTDEEIEECLKEFYSRPAAVPESPVKEAQSVSEATRVHALACEAVANVKATADFLVDDNRQLKEELVSTLRELGRLQRDVAVKDLQIAELCKKQERTSSVFSRAVKGFNFLKPKKQVVLVTDPLEHV